MKERIEYLDGLRAIAVLLVVLDHLAWHSPLLPNFADAPVFGQTWPNIVAHLFLEGSHGVDLFFVISGFCLSYPTLHALKIAAHTDFDIGHFLARRIVRIVPPFYCALLLFGVPRILQHDVGVTDLLKQALFFNPGTAVVNESFWTLAVEFRWYLCFPLLLWLWMRAPRIFLALLITDIAAFNLTTVCPIDVGTLPAFMLGIVAADIQINKHHIGRWALLGSGVMLVAAITLEPLFAPSGAHNTVSFAQTQITWQVAAFFFVVASGWNKYLRRLLSTRVLIAIGIASYSIYLVHAPIVGAADIWLTARYGLVAASLAGMIVTLAISFEYWRLFERPFVQSALKPALVSYVLRFLRRSAAYLGIPLAYQLDRRSPISS